MREGARMLYFARNKDTAEGNVKFPKRENQSVSRSQNGRTLLKVFQALMLKSIALSGGPDQKVSKKLMCSSSVRNISYVA